MTPTGSPLHLRINYSACRGRTRCGKCLRLVPELARGPVSFADVDDIPESVAEAVNTCPEQALIF